MVRLTGSLDMANSAGSRQALSDIIENGNGRLVIDLGEIDRVDSSGLSVLVTALKHIDARNGRLLLSDPPAHVQSLFGLTRLNEVFHVFPSMEAAADALIADG